MLFVSTKFIWRASRMVFTCDTYYNLLGAVTQILTVWYTKNTFKIFYFNTRMIEITANINATTPK